MRTEWPEQLSPEVWADNLYQEAKKIPEIWTWLETELLMTKYIHATLVYKVVSVQYGIWGFQVRYGFKVQYL